jgi:signal transduction histidine kinase
VGARTVSDRTTRRVRAGLIAAAAAMALILAVLRLGITGPLPPGSPDDLSRLLLALALLCVACLTHRSHPTTSWLATIGAAVGIALDLAIYARVAMDAHQAEVAWQWFAIGVSLAALIAVAAAAAYGGSRRRLKGGRLSVEATLVATAGFSGVAVWAIANPDAAPIGLSSGSSLGSLSIVARSSLLLTGAFTLIGVFGDVLPSAERAWRRTGLTHPGPMPPPVRLRAWLAAFVDDLAPGRQRARAAVLAERSRIAADLHADVVPGLRQALTRAEAGASQDELAAALRGVLSDVEGVGAERHTVQLDIGGLVPALAWLAERVERRSRLPITIDVADVDGDPPPQYVSAAAFRIASLALSNVASHGGGSEAEIFVRAESRRVDLAVRDRGPGITPTAIAAARERGHRGIADMAAEAAACGATLDIGPGDGGVGTVVTFAWRAADESAER